MPGPTRDTDDLKALFVPDGVRLVPTDYARGPWSPDSLHGGPVAAAVVRETERSVPADDGLRTTRITLELLRPVGTAPLTVTGAVVRPGRKVQVVDTVVEQGGVEVAWARAVRMRVDLTLHVPVPDTLEDPAPGPPSAGVPVPFRVSDYPGFHNAGVEIRYLSGRIDRAGPATAWFRLAVPVVAGEQPSPEQRAVAVSDFGNGISAELDFATATFINPDLSVHLLRPPVGEWICLDARTRFGPPGTGLAESALWDGEGRVGRALQSLYVELER
ncbi:MAG TPA: thioesterase family protein [Acidimicrobiales bacterium]